LLLGNLLPDALMGPGSVEVVDIGVEHPVELLLMQNEQVIKTLAPHASEKSFTGRIRSRGVIRDVEHLDMTRVRNTGEAHPKLTIVVTDEILWPLAKGGGFSQLLRDPGVCRRSCDADMNHSPRVQVNDEEGKERTEKEVGDREKVTGLDLLRMSVQEGCPGLPMWSSRAHLSHVLLDRAFTDVDT
jgi:hypothetical protein